MKDDITKHIETLRVRALPKGMRLALKDARQKRGWTQRDLARRVGHTQTHISGIESGKIVPRYDTLLELVRTLDSDLLMVPRALVPVVQSLIRDHTRLDQGGGYESSLYADETDEESNKEPRDEV